jgi:hypothetical protein
VFFGGGQRGLAHTGCNEDPSNLQIGVVEHETTV